MRLPCFLVLLSVSCTSSPSPSVAPKGLDAGLQDASRFPDPPPFEGPPNFTQVLGTFETPYEAKGSRGKNVRLAAYRVTGTVLPPGGIFSFNSVVGPRTEARGFFEAGVIYKGEMTHGMGGGVCQVSSTLHAAALLAGLEVVERTPHSRPSGYITMGLDATVTIAEECEADPKSKDCYIADLRFRNPYPLPVLFEMESVPSKKRGMATLRATVLGGVEPLPHPLYVFSVKDEKPFERRVRESDDAGAPTCVQKGIVGRTVLGRIVLKGKGAEDVVRAFESKYPPTDEIWEVPPGFEGELPLDAGVAGDAQATDASGDGLTL